MNTTAVVLISILIVMLMLILGVLVFLVYRLMKGQILPPQSQDYKVPDAQYHPLILERMKEMQKVSPKRADLFCPNHPDEPGEASCAVCDRLFCKQCIRPFKALHFCKEHLALVMKYEWEEVLTLKTSTHDPEKGVRLYDEKRRLFIEQDLPSYIETHYKIEVDQDYIETYLVLYARREDLETMKDSLKSY